ncbi:MAG: response regulator [Bilophila wadsworthia]
MRPSGPDGAEALDQVVDAHERGNGYDVCLIDWKMPEMDGIEATRRIREVVGPETLIIIITAYDWTSIEQRAREAGANAFLSKPLLFGPLSYALRRIAKETRLRRGGTGTGHGGPSAQFARPSRAAGGRQRSEPRNH